MPLSRVVIQNEEFDISAEIDAISNSGKNIGAVVSFTGLCRDENGTLSALELEHYPGMAEQEISDIVRGTIERFALDGMTVIHRYGKIAPGEKIVLVVAAAPHRQAAFDGANYLMDYLKSRAPFWKKQHMTDGTSGGWVQEKDSDKAALLKWQ